MEEAEEETFMRDSVRFVLPALLMWAAVVGINPSFAAGAAAGGVAPSGGGITSNMGVGPSGPTGNASFAFPTAIPGQSQGVGPAGPPGNSTGLPAQTNAGFPNQTTVGIQRNNAGFGFSTQAFGFALNGWNGYGFFPYAPTDDDLLKQRLKEAVRARETAPQAMPLTTSIQHRGAKVVAIKEQVINGQVVRSEGTMIQEYSPRPSSRMAVRPTTRTLARTIPKKHCNCK